MDERRDRELAGDKRHIVVLSDIHIGTDVPTVWFQPEIHQRGLERVLKWVVDQASHIKELILLGDVVDLWTYPMDMKPPTFGEIIETHPTIFGEQGLIAECLEALEGAVTYLPGNHDMGVCPEDVARIRSASGHSVGFGGDLYRPTKEVLVEHGHHHTLFNSPYPNTRWGELPIGYFITRAVSTATQRRLEPGQSVADLPEQGAPNGIDLSSLGSALSGIPSASIAATVLDFIVGSTGVGWDEEIVMVDNTTTTLREVREVYLDLWSAYGVANGGGTFAHAVSYRAAMADLDGSYLGWFAQRRALLEGAELVVMGHTHTPVGSLEDGFVEYVNSGYDCPSLPDQQRDDDPQRATFVVVDLEPECVDAEVWVIGEVIEPLVAAPARVVGSMGSDYSCYVEVDNTVGTDRLELVDHGASFGVWVVDPPAAIEAGSEGRMWLQDQIGVAGSDGWATYRRSSDGGLIDLKFTCPTMGLNACSGTPDFATRTGSEPWQDHAVSHWGHPFSVAFEVR
ncbi:MAG: metallophosphoesterase [Acidimicrobiales bacterium]|nr:metallophosphoesterase [Acidimicrobiales bacterium]